MNMKRVSFKVAKILKEAGYPQDQTVSHYTSWGELVYYGIAGEDGFDVPTYFDVWLWLWREKKYRILLSASNQRWNEVHGIVDGVNGIVETSWYKGLPGYDATNHNANHIDPEEAIEAAIEFLVNNSNLIK